MEDLHCVHDQFESDSDATIDYEYGERRLVDSDSDATIDYFVNEDQVAPSDHDDDYDTNDEQDDQASHNAQYGGSESDREIDSDSEIEDEDWDNGQGQMRAPSDEDDVQHNDIDGHWPEGNSDDDFVWEIDDLSWYARNTRRESELPHDLYHESSEREAGDQRLFLSILRPAYRRRLIKTEESKLLNMTNQAKCTMPSPDRHGQDHPDDYWIKNWHFVKGEDREQSRVLMQEWNRDKTVSSSRDGKPFFASYENDLTL